MRHDPRNPVLVSNLLPGDYSLRGERRFVVCGACHTWRRVREGQLWPHKGKNGDPCPQSRRKVWFDLTPRQQHQARTALLAAETETAARRTTRRRRPPVPAARPRQARRPGLRPGWDEPGPTPPGA
jgi:hypothetical protein